MSDGQGTMSSTATKFLAIVSGTGLAVAAVAAMTPPGIAAVAALAGLGVMAKAGYDALPPEPERDQDDDDLQQEGQQEEQQEPETEQQPETLAQPEQDTDIEEPTPQQEGPPSLSRRKKGKKKKKPIQVQDELPISTTEQEPDEDETEEKSTSVDQAADDDAGWQTQKTRPKRAPKTEQEKADAREREIARHAEAIVDLAISVVGSPNFPVDKQGERAGCVKHGPGYSVPQSMAAAVRALIDAEEGRVVQAGGMSLTIHIVNKSATTYNVTLHRQYRQANPQTKANVHVDANMT